VLNWFGSFGYFSDAENLAALRCLARSLRPAGRLLIDFLNRDFFSSAFVGEVELPGGTILSQWDEASERLRLTYPGPYVAIMRLYTRAQIESMMRAAGMRIVETFGSEYGDPVDANSKRFVVLAQRQQ
jgi:hypothetical protein